MPLHSDHRETEAGVYPQAPMGTADLRNLQVPRHRYVSGHFSALGVWERIWNRGAHSSRNFRSPRSAIVSTFSASRLHVVRFQVARLFHCGLCVRCFLSLLLAVDRTKAHWKQECNSGHFAITVCLYQFLVYATTSLLTAMLPSVRSYRVQADQTIMLELGIQAIVSSSVANALLRSSTPSLDLVTSLCLT